MSAGPTDPPVDPLAAAESAYTAGDFAGVREACAGLQRAGEPTVAARARALAARVELEPAGWIAVGVCTAVFLAIVVAYGH